MKRLAVFVFILFTLPSLLVALTPEEFQSPPDSARPWVYWFIMDGNLTREGITADLESMKNQGIGGVILMEVNVGVPRGKVDFMSEEWQRLFAHAVRETERLGIQLTLNSGPGWTGSGGPWITPEKSMWHLVASEETVQGPVTFNKALPKPQPRKPYFGEGAMPELMEKARKEFFKDVRVLAFPKPQGTTRTADIDEKALYIRHPYSSRPGVKPRLSAPASFQAVPAKELVNQSQIIDLTNHLDASGVLKWEVPPGEWTILRLAATSTGANTRPAPTPGLGLECSKMDRDAFDIHAANFINKLFKAVEPRQRDGKAGWCFFHIDSWEMGSQNYSDSFLNEFKQRRGYDPVPFLPAYLGFIVESPEKTERFLWDIRQTIQELIIENHGIYLREIAHKNGLELSIEPYDLMPCCNMTFGTIADVPMCEFWSNTFDTAFSCFEAASVANIHGKPVVSAEAFTSGGDQWKENPKTMKQRGDWAFCSGVSRFTFHRSQHQPFLDRYPGFSMGPYGVHWERTQTWWPLIYGYHQYLARCQYLLQQGTAVVDVLYLLPEGTPQVFTPPESALMISGTIKDQRGYRFDGCDPPSLIDHASIKDGNIAFPSGMTYKLLVLPDVETMTLPLLKKIESLVRQGATIVGNPPKQSPSLQNYPLADQKIQMLAEQMWGKTTPSKEKKVIPYGKGSIIVLPTTSAFEQPITFSGAKWIWYPEGKPEHDAPAGTRYFRKTIRIPEGHVVRSARLLGTADNDIVVKVNGQEVHKANLSDHIKTKHFQNELKTGDNRIEIEAINGISNQRNPAGLVAQFEIISVAADTQAESTIRFATDDQWESSQDGKMWKTAMVLGNFGMSPWSISVSSANSGKPLYPDYAITAQILSDKGINVDFDATEKGLRFYHRGDEKNDYYFVGNKTDSAFQGEVSFRVADKKCVSIWDPLTGRIFKAPPPKTENGMTSFVLDLKGSQSVFVLFDDKGANSDAAIWQSCPPTSMLELTDNWEVHFDPVHGGQKTAVHFQKLQDWTTYDQDAVRYYSGIATYKKSFTVSPNSIESGKRYWLDLGEVEVMAQVKLNGKQLGVRWIAPYLWEITDGFQTGENVLEIEVANLWTNRLIGDAKLPAEKRVTWTTLTNAYKANSPLLPSGLLGPVRVLKEQ